MASEKRTLDIIHARSAVEELGDIWLWNAEHYGTSHADAYLAFLQSRINQLADRYARGRPVPGRPGLRYILVRRKARGHGHIVVYSHDDERVRILHIFHTARNWQNELGHGEP